MNKIGVFLDLLSILKFSQPGKVCWCWEGDIRDQLHALNKNIYDKVKNKIHSKFALRASYEYLEKVDFLKLFIFKNKYFN
jgi:hypothetical protein